MRLLFSLNGKGAAAVDGATQVPREGDWIFLDLTGSQDLFRVRRVVWDTKIAEGSEGKEGLERLHTESGDVYVLIESMEQSKVISEASS